jgi:hypothetical protein
VSRLKICSSKDKDCISTDASYKRRDERAKSQLWGVGKKEEEWTVEKKLNLLESKSPAVQI